MVSQKRKRDELEDEDEDEPMYGRQILPVANLPHDFNEEPMDGMQYLFTVRRDAQQLPDVVWAPNPYSQPDTKVPEVQAEEGTDVEARGLPSEEWRELFVYRFLNLRKNFDQPTIHVGPPDAGSRQLMPDKKDRDMWWAFIGGQPESEWIPVAKSNQKYQKSQRSSRGLRAWADDPHPETSQNNDEGEVERVLRVDPAETLPSPVGTPIPLDYLEGCMQPGSTSGAETPVAGPSLPTRTIRPREPTPTILKQIDEKMALHLLMYFAHWISLYLKSQDHPTYIPRESHARWMFALLSRIDDHLFADDMNLLRNLARTCLSLLKESLKCVEPLSTAPQDKMSNASCWLIFTLVADFWKQRDLWLDARTELKSR